MWHRYPSMDRLHSTRSDVSRSSPYAKNYRTNFTHDQREQLSHRQNISRLPRRELEDRHIALVDEHYALKKENAANNEKIKKMATKLLRLSAEGKSRGTPFPLQLSPNEHLEIQIIRLEAYNALLKDRLNAVIKKYSNCVQSGATSAIRRPASCSNLSIKRKIILSQDDLNLLEIPEPPTLVSKIDNRSSCGSGSGITSGGRKQSPTKSTSEIQYRHKPQQSQSSMINEIDEGTQSTEEKITANDPKNSTQKLPNDSTEAKGFSDSNKHLNVVLEEQVYDESKAVPESVQLEEMRRTMADCEAELHELRQQYMNLKTKAECELDEGHKRIDELTRIVHSEVEKNNQLSNELHALQNATDAIETIQSIERVQSKSKIPDETSVRSPPKNDDLPELLNEAKQTILQLQKDVNALKTHIEALRKQNDEYVKEIEELKVAKDVHQSDDKPPIPLEPIVIVNEVNGEKMRPENLMKKHPDSASSIDHSYVDDQSSDDTYVVSKEKLNEHGADTRFDRNHRDNSSYNKDTDSEISSFESDENFRAFQHKNKELQSSLLYQNAPMSFMQRMSLLERTAYYQPLVSQKANTTAATEDHYVACNCAGFECDQQTEHFYEAIRKSVKAAKTILLKEIQENLESNRNDSSPFPRFVDDSSECREFLRVQYNLNSLFKQELEMVCKTCKKQTQQLLNEIDALKLKLDACKEKLKGAQLANTATMEGHSLKMLHIGYDEGSFELHVNAFRPTKEGRTLLSCRHGELSSLFISWNFFNINFESKTSISSPPTYTYRSNYIYVVPMKKEFLDQLQDEKLTIRLFAMAGSNEIQMGSSTINFAEVLVFPQNKIQLTTKMMSVSNECDHSYDKYCACSESARKSKHLGNLTIWFRLTCELDVLKSFASKHWISKPCESNCTVEKKSHRIKSTKCLISITIVRLKLNNLAKLQNEQIHEISIEYHCLGERQLKTRSCTLDSNELQFDYKHKFPQTERSIQRLNNMLRNTERSIKIIVVNSTMPKPQENDNDSTTDCMEIGFGLLHLGKLVRNWIDDNVSQSFEIPILMKKQPYENIGSLEIRIDDMASLKRQQQQLEIESH